MGNYSINSSFHTAREEFLEPRLRFSLYSNTIPLDVPEKMLNDDMFKIFF